MDNRVDIENGSLHSEETLSVEDGVSVDRAEEMIEPVSASSEPKDLEEDEVFEEAVGTKEHLPEQVSVATDHDLSSMAVCENLYAADAFQVEKSDLNMKPQTHDTGEHKSAVAGQESGYGGNEDEDLGDILDTEATPEYANLSAEKRTTFTDDISPFSTEDIDSSSDKTKAAISDLIVDVNSGLPPEGTGGNGNGVYTEGVVSKEPEKKDEKLHEEQHTDVEKEEEVKPAADVCSSTPDDVSPPSIEKDLDAMSVKIQARLSELQLDDDKNIQPSSIGGKANEVCTNGDVTKELEKKEEKSEEEQKSQVKEHEVQPVSDVSSSSSNNVGAPREKDMDGIVDKIHTATGILRVGDDSGCKPEASGVKVNELHTNGTMEKELEKKGEKFWPEQKAQAKQEVEVQPAADVGSRSEKSTNPASLPARPAGLGRAAPLLEPAHRAAQQPRPNGSVSQAQAQQIEDTNGEGEETDETRDKLQMIRVKFLRLAHRLGQTPHNVVVAQVLYRLGLAEQLRGRNGGRGCAYSFDRASAMAEQLEAAGQEPLDFSCTIMVLGKSGVGKSATINSIFDEPKFSTDAFHMGTRKVQDVVGTVQGIKVRVIDTPGLLPSWSDQRHNLKILQSIKHFIKKSPPDIVLYLDRLDMQSRDFGDMPLLRTITEIFGPSIWFNAIVVLTHAASAPPEGPNGTVSSYDMFVTQRSHVVQQAIRQAAGDMRLLNPVSLVENHSACRTNRAGQRVLPNGQVWKPHLLLLSFASKILAEANVLLKLQDSLPGKPFPTQTRAPPLPFLLSSLLQSRPPLKLPEEQFGDEDGADDDLDDSSDSDDDTEYDDLPPFKSLSKAQLAKLPKDQRKAYFDEFEHREKLFMKKQLKEERKRRKMMKKMAAAAKEQPSEFVENTEEESGSAASVPVPMPDLALPASFDSDNPTHRYRYLDTSSPWLVRPVLETHGWDHDVGYEGINVERLFVVKEKIPISFSGQVTKDKKDANIQMEVASSVKHGEGKATSLGFDMQTVGKDMAYTLRSETKFSDHKKNKATAGLSVTRLGDALSAGVKIEDRLIVNKRFQMVMTGGAMRARGDIAYGGSLEAQLRDKDYPLGRSLSTLGLSVMDWHGDLAIGCNLQSQIPVGRSTNLIARANLNNRGSGQLSIRLNSSEQLQIILVALIPLMRKLLGVTEQQ